MGKRITPKTPDKQEADELLQILDKTLPTNFKVGRDSVLQLSAIERDLFTDMREAESGNYIISGIQKYVTELDFTAFTFAVGQILYNQSYQSENTDTNSGLKKEKAKNLSNKTGLDLYSGNIIISLSELCRLAFGTNPTTELKRKMATLVETIDKKPVEIRFPNGNKLESKLCAIMNKYTRKKDGAVIYDLYLNPIFGSNVQKNFGELPQDIIIKLDTSCKKKKQRKQAAHYLLLRWLSVQDKRSNHTLTIDTLIQELRLDDYYKKNRGMADKQLISICNTMIDIGMLSNYDISYSNVGKRKYIERICFHLNKSFIRITKDKDTEKP